MPPNPRLIGARYVGGFAMHEKFVVPANRPSKAGSGRRKNRLSALRQPETAVTRPAPSGVEFDLHPLEMKVLIANGKR